MNEAAARAMDVKRPFFRPHLAEASAPPAPPRAAAPAAADFGPDLGLDPGQEARFRAEMLPHLSGAYSLACFLSRDRALAEDIVQDAYLAAWRAFAGWRGGSARAWLFAIVRNGFLSRRARAGSTAPLEAAGDPADEDMPSPEAALAARETVARVRGAIAALPEPFRETVVLRELEELSYKEIAEVTAVPIGTVMSRLARARQMLADILLAEERP